MKVEPTETALEDLLSRHGGAKQPKVSWEWHLSVLQEKKGSELRAASN
jgi:hypothetical protein